MTPWRNFFLRPPLRQLCVAAAAVLDAFTRQRYPVALAPDAADTPAPIVQVYGARCKGWLGAFAIHTWIAVKPAGARSYTVYQVLHGRLHTRGSVVTIRRQAADAPWFGRVPTLLAERRGPGVEALIERIDNAARSYPFPRYYDAWPGPNSNTFTAYVARAVPELELLLPPTAVGKDYPCERALGLLRGAHGWHWSLAGALGVRVSGIDGVEVNLLGLVFGFDPFAAALKLPLLGRLGAAQAPRARRRAMPAAPLAHQPPYSHGDAAIVNGRNGSRYVASTTRRMTIA